MPGLLNAKSGVEWFQHPGPEVKSGRRENPAGRLLELIRGNAGSGSATTSPTDPKMPHRGWNRAVASDTDLALSKVGGTRFESRSGRELVGLPTAAAQPSFPGRYAWSPTETPYRPVCIDVREGSGFSVRFASCTVTPETAEVQAVSSPPRAPRVEHRLAAPRLRAEVGVLERRLLGDDRAEGWSSVRRLVGDRHRFAQVALRISTRPRRLRCCAEFLYACQHSRHGARQEMPSECDGMDGSAA